jgi:hypothetical protein
MTSNGTASGLQNKDAMIRTPLKQGSRCRMKMRNTLVAFLTIGCSALAQVTAPDFSVVVLPDTQFYSESHPAIFNAQTQWIVSNRANYNIQFVLGEGDIVNVADQLAQWQNADAAIKLLDTAKIPYVLPLGNHDYDGFNPPARGTTVHLLPGRKLPATARARFS